MNQPKIARKILLILVDSITGDIVLNNCLHQTLGERTQELAGFQDCANQGRSMSADSDTTLESDLLGWRQRIAMMNYGWRQETTYQTLQKGKD